ncbi:hypothetical protein RJ641_009864 [Dillenia turbinata]|uniref:Uncharacterized protein n=1 Tax=Dillenia turbinata TaxID=194707 RepID=A0AAN8UZH2_9MAGN
MASWLIGNMILGYDTESGYYVPLPNGEATDLTIMRHSRVSKIINAGAVMLTDCAYWLIIFPSLSD